MRFLAPPRAEVGGGAAPSFSVIVAAYQVADVIGDALDSIRQQTLPPLEVIVCDDGSSDDLQRALEPYRDEIVLLQKENGGEASAKNAAAAAASGDFVAILDADDVYLPGRLAALSELAQARPDLDILTTDAFLVVDGRRVRRNYDRGWRFEVADQRRAILQRNFVFGHAAVRRERLLEHGGFDEAILWTTDWELWLRLILAGSRAGCVDEPLALYRLRETSLTAQRRDLLLGKLATLEKARSNPHLRDAERPVLEDSLAAYRRELGLMELRDSLAAGSSDARSRALKLLRAPRQGLRSRLVLAAMAAAPTAAGRFLRRRASGSWVGAGGIRVPRAHSRVVGRRVRLVAYTDNVELGGADISMSHVLARLDPSIEVTVLGVAPMIVERIAAGRNGSATRIVPRPRSGHDWTSLRAHVRALREIDPDVVHANLSSPWSCQYCIAAAGLVRHPRVVAVYQLAVPSISRAQWRAKRLTARAVDRHVGVGERTSREVENLVGLPAGSVLTIHNGVPDQSHDAADRPRPGPLVGAIGRFERQKGFDVLIRALADVEDVSLVLVGEGSERPGLEELAESVGVADRVVWQGWTDDARSYLGSFDVFALPSRFEGFPLALLEALLARSAVVAADVGSVAEAVRDGETGLLVPAEDPRAFAVAIRRLLADAELRRRLGEQGRRLVLERFTANHMTQAFERLYGELLSREDL